MPNIAIAITNYDWFLALRHRHDLDEVNFWTGSFDEFRALRPGELLLFKLKARHGNLIVGGGIFAHSEILPVSFAWETFREANGAGSLEELREMITGRRSGAIDNQGDFHIRVRVLTQPFFFDEEDWMAPPSGWSKYTVRYKGFSTDDAEIRNLWQRAQHNLGRQNGHPITQGGTRYGEPHLITPRLGQGGFRLVVRDTYKRRCAITRVGALPALEAAHIRPYHRDGEHEVTNGLLLRRDIHRLFDLGYLTVTPSYEVEVSKSLREEFGSDDYNALHGTRIAVPKDDDLHPDREMLAWHNENVFKE